MAEEDDALAATQGLHDDDKDPDAFSIEDCATGSSLRATAEDIRVSMGDAEDASVGFLVDLVDDIFAEMRVKDENEKAVRAAVSFAWQQTLDGCLLAAANGPETMDAGVFESKSHQWRQFVRPRIQDEDESAVAVQTQPRRLNTPGIPVVAFLGRLWKLFDRGFAWVEKQLAQYPTSAFRVSSLPTPAHKGDWEIPVDDLGNFLRSCLRAARLSVLSSAVDAVIQANATLLDKKRKARANLQLHHITMCVQTALLAAEEAEATQAEPQDSRSHIFQTELEGELSAAQDEWLVYYSDDQGDHSAPPIDRNATGSVVSKRELSSEVAKKQKLARSVVFSLLQQQRRDSSDSKWGALRKRVLILQDRHVGIAVEADMALVVTDPHKALSPKKKSSTMAAAATADTMTARLSPHKTRSDPDTAALSNIFSLGTPRQLSGDELARRNDILSVLEREEAQVSRRMAVASIAAATVPPQCVGTDGKPILSETDKAFQEYVAANSSITVTSGSCHVPAHAHGEELSPSKQVTKRPSESKRTGHGAGAGGGNGGRTKFDLALDPPRFDVVEGNSHVRMAAEAAAAAASTPLSRKSKSRGGALAKTAVSPLLHAPSPPTSPMVRSPQPPPQPHTQHLRPLETASGQLPQLDTSRLAVGVKAVVRGVEKRGPRHDPSRNSRLRLHNYVSSADDEPKDAGPVLSPSKPSIGGSTPGSQLPPVSPVKASPHRKHVTFPPSPVAVPKPAIGLSPQRPPPHELVSPVPPNGSRRFPAKQPTYEKQTSPPRVRNRHLTDSSNNPSKNKRKHLARHSWAMEDDNDPGSPDSQSLRAPRRDLAYSKSVDGDDE